MPQLEYWANDAYYYVYGEKIEINTKNGMKS